MDSIITRQHRINAVLASKRSQEDEDHLPQWQTCSYAAFLRWLEDQHGVGYLLRPDGQPLEPMQPESF